MMNKSFFSHDTFFIDERVNFMQFESFYKVYDEGGEIIGSIRQKMTAGDKMLRLFFKKKTLPFTIEIRNAQDDLEATVTRGWTFWLSNIRIQNAQGLPVGTIRQKFRILKPKFQIFNTDGLFVAEISGDWKAWSFSIKDSSDLSIGSISKKWAGAMKEIFTTADKYNVRIDPKCSVKEHRIAILAGAITIDMVLKESE